MRRFTLLLDGKIICNLNCFNIYSFLRTESQANAEVCSQRDGVLVHRGGSKINQHFDVTSGEFASAEEQYWQSL